VSDGDAADADELVRILARARQLGFSVTRVATALGISAADYTTSAALAPSPSSPGARATEVRTQAHEERR
jgi:hypothetical protein